MQLTSFSKILIVLGVFGLIAITAITCNQCLQGCNRQQQYNQGYQQPTYYPPQQPTYQTVIQPDGSSFVMNYLLWRSLMDQGGPNVVNNYYNQHRNDDDFRPEKQQQYRQVAENEVKTQKSSGFGSKPTQTQFSNGFGNKPVQTQSSRGFGSSSSPSTYSSPSSQSRPNLVSTNRSSGFGSSSSKSTSTSSSRGFGKKN
jgi:hypothetical protein